MLSFGSDSEEQVNEYPEEGYPENNYANYIQPVIPVGPYDIRVIHDHRVKEPVFAAGCPGLELI
jgi:hypothetical protein